jgi:CBS domain containing-hemolysin-like protein
VGVAASTLAAAALFNPLRRRLQRLVDRRFNRTSYTADAILGAFAGRLRDEVELDAIQHHLIEAAAVALAPAHASLWIRPEAGPTEAT